MLVRSSASFESRTESRIPALEMLLAIIDLYSLVVIGAVIISWIQLPPSNPIANIIRSLTEPVLAPIRRVVPAMSGLDFSPLLLLIGLQMLKGLLF